MQQFNTGDSFLDFTLEDILGGGAFAQTWKAYESSLDRHVALKLYVQESSYRLAYGDDDPDFEEGKFLSDLPKNTFVADVYRAGFDQETGVRYLAQELIEGTPLSQVRFDSIKDITTLLIYLCSGLEFIHSQGLIHNDVKPDNIILTSEKFPVLIDWGSCIRQGNSIENKKGSILYRAPEKFTGIATPKTDVYAICVMGYHLLSLHLKEQGITNPLFPHQSPVTNWSTLSEDQIQEQRHFLRISKHISSPKQLQGIPSSLWNILKCGLHPEESKRLSLSKLKKKLYSFNQRKKRRLGFLAAGILGCALGIGYHSEPVKLFRGYWQDQQLQGQGNYLTASEITSSPEHLSELAVVFISGNSLNGVDDKGKIRITLSDSLEQHKYCVNSKRQIFYPYKNTLRLLDLTNNTHEEIVINNSRITDVACSLAGLVAFQTESQLFTYNVEQQRKELIEDHRVEDLTLSPYGSYLAGMSSAGTLYIRNINQRKTSFRVLEHLDTAHPQIRWVGSEDDLISYRGKDGHFHLYNIKTKEDVASTNLSAEFEYTYSSPDDCVITYPGSSDILIHERNKDPRGITFPKQGGNILELDASTQGGGFTFTYSPSSSEDSDIWYYHPSLEKFICLTDNDAEDSNPHLLTR